jgi:hypothetical protein
MFEPDGSTAAPIIGIYFLLRAASGNAISNEKPSFVAGDDGGCGSARFGSSGAADLVLALIATFVTAGASQLPRLSLLWPVLVVPIAELRKLTPSRVLWDRVKPGKARYGNR